MKNLKKISLILVATFTFGGVVMANEACGGKRNIDPKVRAEKMTERMVEEYKLTDVQKQQLLEVNQAFAEKMGNRPAAAHRHGKKGKHSEMAKAKKENKDGVAKHNKEGKNKEKPRADRPDRKKPGEAPRLSAEAREKRQQEMKQVREDYHAQLQKIMNADQYQAFTKKQAERVEKRQERAEKMKENRPKRRAPEKRGEKA